MAEEKNEVSLSELNRWMVLFAVIIIGAGLFFWLAPSTGPIVRPARSEVAP